MRWFAVVLVLGKVKIPLERPMPKADAGSFWFGLGQLVGFFHPTDRLIELSQFSLNRRQCYYRGLILPGGQLTRPTRGGQGLRAITVQGFGAFCPGPGLQAYGSDRILDRELIERLVKISGWSETSRTTSFSSVKAVASCFNKSCTASDCLADQPLR